jgi:NAD(P)-dependent dehydrogenase (short-subunit alcohol dehydrogenase family)
MQAIDNQVVLVTGATDGLGKQVVHDLAERGATVLIHGRNRKKGEATLEEIQGATGNDRLKYYNADFSSLAAVWRLGEEVRAHHDRLNILINNAGIGAGPRTGTRREESMDGNELRFAINYLAPFLLTHRLLPLLRRSSPARIINVASAGQQSIDFDDAMLEYAYDGFRAYSQSKLALMMLTFDLAEELEESGVTANSLHPATLMNTNMVHESFGRTMSTVKEGADAVEYIATSPELEGITGEHFDGKRPSRANAQAYDREARRRLRQLSESLTQLTGYAQ